VANEVADDGMPPGYYWGTEQAPPADADTADRVEVKVDYGVQSQRPDGAWQWIGCGFPSREGAEDQAANYTGTSTPVPVHRQVIEVTRTFYVWDARGRVAAAEAHVVLSEHHYTGPSDPWARF
jgi:hypothetical protein